MGTTGPNSWQIKLTITLISLVIGVGGVSEGPQILLLGILFQRLHHNNTNVWTKNQDLSFLVVSTTKF